MKRRLKNALSRLRRGPEHRRASGWERFETEVADRSGPGSEILEAALADTLSRTAASRAQPRLEAVEARRRRLLDSEAQVVFRVEGDPPSSGKAQIVGPLCEKACKPPSWSLLLHHLAARRGARRVVELGTCFGVSAAYLAAAVGDEGSVFTLEGCEDYARIARDTFREVEAPEVELVFGRFERTLPATLARAAPVDLFFLDGHHDEVATAEYLALAEPHLAPGAVVVFDDIRWSPGMTRAWQRLRRDGWTDLGSVGVVVLAEAAGPQ